jgi:hypothetical protein
MNTENKYEVPSTAAGDVVHTAVKAAISVVPIYGGPAAEIFGLVIAPPLQRRQVEWMNEVAAGLNVLEEKIEGFRIENLRENQQFISAVLSATQGAVRDHSQEKRDALRNAVLNVAVGSKLTADKEMIFLYLIDHYTGWHLRILRLFQNPLELAAEKKITPDDYSIAGSRTDLLERYYPDMKGQRQFYSILVSELASDGMLGVQDLQGMVTGQWVFQKLTTDWADQFVAFITSPI